MFGTQDHRWQRRRPAFDEVVGDAAPDAAESAGGRPRGRQLLDTRVAPSHRRLYIAAGQALERAVAAEAKIVIRPGVRRRNQWLACHNDVEDIDIRQGIRWMAFRSAAW
jgi:hypothetical protein